MTDRGRNLQICGWMFLSLNSLTTAGQSEAVTHLCVELQPAISVLSLDYILRVRHQSIYTCILSSRVELEGDRRSGREAEQEDLDCFHSEG